MPPVSSAGITVNSTTGEHYIPASLRPDGSKRREIRVRPGYKPPEDIQLYRTRAAEAREKRAKAGVPGAESPSFEESSNINKNAKRREARRQAKTEGGGQDQDLSQVTPSANGKVDTRGLPNGRAGARDSNNKKDALATNNWRSFAADGDREKKAQVQEQKQEQGQQQQQQQQQQQPEQEPVDPEAEKDKKARNLKKKLRQARDLSDKRSQGGSLLPEQLDKVIKIQELTRQLSLLGLDANDEETKPAEKETKPAEGDKGKA